MRLNSVVLPAPLGPMMALRSPGMTRSETSRVALSPPKLLARFFSSRTGTAASSTALKPQLIGWRTGAGAFGPGVVALLAELTGREILAVNRLLQEGLLAVGPELADVRVGLDDGVPELFLVVAEHLLLLDFFDVDVLDRVTHLVHHQRPANRIELDALHGLDEGFRARPLAAGLLDGLVDPFGGRVVILRIIRRHLVVLGAVGFHEGFVLRRFQRRAVMQRRDVADYFVAHERQREFVIAGTAAEDRLLDAGAP